MCIRDRFTWSPTAKFSFNWSGFAGNTKPDSLRQLRYFQNIYAQWAPVPEWHFTTGLDFGLEQKSKSANRYYSWFAPIIQVSYSKQQWSFAARAEYFNDVAGVIMPKVQQQPFRMQSYSVSVNRNLGTFFSCRTEYRFFKHDGDYFLYNNQLRATNQMFTTSLFVDFKR